MMCSTGVQYQKKYGGLCRTQTVGLAYDVTVVLGDFNARMWKNSSLLNVRNNCAIFSVLCTF